MAGAAIYEKQHSPRVLFLVAHGFDACLLYRCWFIVKALRANGYVADWRYFERFNDECKPLLFSGRYDVVVTPRYSLKESWMTDRWVQLVRDAGLLWCYEADDDLFSPEVIERQCNFFFSLWPNAEHAGVEYGLEWERQERLRLLTLVDGAIVSTEPLATVVRGHTDKPVYVVPNAIDLEWFRSRMNRKARMIPPLTVGWSGGWRIDADIAPIAVAWGRLAQQYPNVNFVVYGWNAPMFKKLIPDGRLAILPWGAIGKYPAGLRNIDIACCSVADNDWNKCKSAIKWFEATAAGSACVVSDTLYGSVVTDSDNALVAKTADDWYLRIQDLIESPRLRRVIRTQALGTVEWRYEIKHHWSKWVDVWTEMLEHARQPVAAA